MESLESSKIKDMDLKNNVFQHSTTLLHDAPLLRKCNAFGTACILSLKESFIVIHLKKSESYVGNKEKQRYT
jgi:phosphoribulokinase